VLTFHRPPLEEEAVFAGHLLVTPKRHVLDFAALELEESAVMGIAIAKDFRLLKQLGAARVYVATVGHHEITSMFTYSLDGLKRRLMSPGTRSTTGTERDAPLLRTSKS